jgi:3'-phosphoadenosine 5'-phosphosulfate sulfotransferase (PAPS reductase)/FAD synthetase
MDTANIISISGTKGNPSMLLFAIKQKSEYIQAIFADTGHKHHLTYDYFDYLENMTGVRIQHVKANFAADMARKRHFITENYREIAS